MPQIKSPMKLQHLLKKARKAYTEKANYTFTAAQNTAHTQICTALVKLHNDYSTSAKPKYKIEEVVLFNGERDEIASKLKKFRKGFKEANKTKPKGKFWHTLGCALICVQKLARDDLDPSADEKSVTENAADDLDPASDSDSEDSGSDDEGEEKVRNLPSGQRASTTSVSTGTGGQQLPQTTSPGSWQRIQPSKPSNTVKTTTTTSTPGSAAPIPQPQATGGTATTPGSAAPIPQPQATGASGWKSAQAPRTGGGTAPGTGTPPTPGGTANAPGSTAAAPQPQATGATGWKSAQTPKPGGTAPGTGTPPTPGDTTTPPGSTTAAPQPQATGATGWKSAQTPKPGGGPTTGTASPRSPTGPQPQPMGTPPAKGGTVTTTTTTATGGWTSKLPPAKVFEELWDDLLDVDNPMSKAKLQQSLQFVQVTRKCAQPSSPILTQEQSDFLGRLDTLELMIQEELGKLDQPSKEKARSPQASQTDQKLQAEAESSDQKPKAKKTSPEKVRAIQNQRALAGGIQSSLQTLQKTGDFGARAVESLNKAAKPGLFSKDKAMAGLAKAMSTYVQLKNQADADPQELRQAWQQVDAAAANCKDTSDQELVEGVRKKWKTLEETPQAINDQANKLFKEVLLAVTESSKCLKKQPYKGPTANGTSLRLLEDLAKLPGLPMELKEKIVALLATAGPILKQLGDARLNDVDDEDLEGRAAILIEHGGCKPPSTKGMSDSFLICNTDGKPAFFFKPQDGEAYPGADWPAGGGVPREVLLSKLSEQLSQDLGLDCHVPRTDLVELSDETFCTGSISQNTERVGALVEAVKFQPGDPSNAAAWFEFKTGTVSEEDQPDVAAQMAQLNPKQCQAVMLLNFITLDVDSNAGNILVTDTNAGPGQANIVPIDAGRKMPRPDAYKRACATMSLRFPPKPGLFKDDEPFLLQTPAALQPFDNDMVQAVRKMDPAKIVQGMRSAYTDVVQQAPDMKDTVDAGSFDLVQKSIQFLKKAVEQNPPLTPFDVAEVYARGFAAVVDAQTPQEADQAIQDALRAIQTIKANGGDAEIERRKITLAGGARSLTLQQQARILGQPPLMDKASFEQDDYVQLQGQLADIGQYLTDGPEKITDELTRPFSAANYQYLKLLADYKLLGGDPMLKKMIDCAETYAVEVAQPLATRSVTPWEYAQKYVKLGGTAAFIKLIGPAKFDQLRGKTVTELYKEFDKALTQSKQ